MNVTPGGMDTPAPSALPYTGMRDVTGTRDTSPHSGRHDLEDRHGTVDMLPHTGRRAVLPDSQARILLLALLPIGDTLLTTPTIGALRARYPRARITALAHSAAAPVLARVPAVDDVLVLPVGADWGGPRLLLEMLARLRARRFDAAIDFTSPAYKWISLLCGIPLRTYMKFDPLWWLLPGTHAAWRATHATRHYYDCARELDLPTWEQARHTPALALAAAERADARRFLRRASEGVGMTRGPLIGLHAGGAWLGALKQWPPERFAALAAALQRRWDARIVLLGGAEERGRAERIAARLPAPSIIAAGAAPLLTSLALIEACDLFIGDDSGLLHAAAALGRPYIGVFGPTWPANFAPVGPRPDQGAIVLPAVACRAPRYFVGGAPIMRRTCCDGACRALATIGAAEVLARAEAMLAGRFAPALPGSVPFMPRPDEVPAR